LIGLNAAASQQARLQGMDTWIDIARWVVAAVGAIIVVGALAMGAMAWLLNHPD
jgi:hypothetical protein